MAEEAKAQATTYDLTREVPAGVQLSGLSAPKFDGVNYFRQPLAGSSSLKFFTPGSRFAQLEYQLYAPTSAVTVQLNLDGKSLSSQTFPAGRFVSNAVQGGFVDGGEHSFTLTYRCTPACAQPPSQYWTKLQLIEDVRVMAAQDTGIGVQKLWVNAPASRLQITGTGPVMFDGVNYRRPVEGPGFTLSWPVGWKPLNTSFILYADQPFRVTTRVGQRVMTVNRGDSKTSVNPTISLAAFPQAHDVSVQVECLTGPQPQGCASLYFPSVSVLSPSPVSALFPLAILTTAAMLIALAAGLELWPAGFGLRRKS